MSGGALAAAAMPAFLPEVVALFVAGAAIAYVCYRLGLVPIAGFLIAGKTTATGCAHLDQARPVTPSARGCEDCLRTGDSWVHLRLCLTCGHVGGCDSSKNQHATRHSQATTHPIVKSLEPGEDWGWCYVDQVML